jgi:phosphatidylserine/phosphatidylglycerophosphate/cardiolipin synthase-like enzyme
MSTGLVQAHEIETRISRAGLESLGPALASQLPSEIQLPEMNMDLFECSGDDAGITIENTRVVLDVQALELSQPASGQLQLDLALSARADGDVRFRRVIFCGSEFTCQNSLELREVGARVLLESQAGGDGSLGLEVVDVELDLDANRFDLSLSGCEYAELANTAVDLLETVGVSVLSNLVEDIARDELVPALESAAAGLSDARPGILNWELQMALQGLDLSNGLATRADVDIQSERAPASCLQDPGEPDSHPGAPPLLERDTDIRMSFNLGLVDDLLYHMWSSSAQCPGLASDGSFIGNYLVGFPEETEWRLQATLEAPPYVEGVGGDELALELVWNDIALELEAELPGGTRRSAQLVVDARARVGLAIIVSDGAISLQVDDARVTRLVLDDELNLVEQGFDAAHITHFLNEVYLPEQLSSYLDSDVRLPLGLGLGDTHVIVRELRTNSAFASLGLDLFVAPESDTAAPDTQIVSFPTAVVRHSQALLYLAGSDSQVPAELLRYQVTVNGVEMPVSKTSRVLVGLPNHSATYAVEVAAVDLAGNVDPSPARAELQVDGVRPEVEVDWSMDGNAVDLEFRSQDDRSPASALRTRIVVTEVDTGTEVQRRLLASGSRSARLEDLASGQDYRVTVVVLDEVGNEGGKSFVIATASVGGCSAGGGSTAMGAFLLLLVLVLVGTDTRRLLSAACVTLLALFGAACGEEEAGVPGTETLELPACASELAQSMWSEMQPVAQRSTISMDAALGRASGVDPKLYIDGPEIFSKWASLVEEAEVEVDMQFYKWEPETDATETILAGIKALEERRRGQGASSPIPVRILIDTSALGVAAPVTETHMPWVMERVEAYEIDPTYVDLRFAVLERGFLNQFANLHVKSMVVDGRVAMITGANPEHQHNFDEPCHDLGTVFYGDIVEGILEDIDYSWEGAQYWVCPSSSDERSICLAPASVPLHQAAAQGESLPGNACAVLGLSRTPSLTANNDIDNPQDQAFLAAFDGARQIIKIETPNINDDAVKAALLNAVKRGVEVRLITSKEFNETSEGFVGGPNGENVAELYRDLALLGVPDACSKLKVRWYSKDGLTPILGNGAYASHTKYSSMDEQIVIVGTTNMDTASWNFSHEFNLAIDDAELAKKLNQQLFDADWERALTTEECAP